MIKDAIKSHFESLQNAIEERRTRLVEERFRLLDILDRDWREARKTEVTPKTEWMLANHIFYEAREGAAARDPERVAVALGLWNELSRLVTSPALSRNGKLDVLVGELTDEIAAASVDADMPVFALTEPLLDSVDDTRTSLVAASLDCLTATHLNYYTDAALSLVVLLHRRELGEATSSWANEAFPCTIYTDYYEDPYLLAKDILHETVHGWLNEAMAARRVELPEEMAYYSPWKSSLRPAYGIIHSGMAFSHVVILLSRLASLNETPDYVKEYTRRRIGTEVQRLRSAEAEIRNASVLMRCEEIETILDSALEEAMSVKQ